MEPNGHLEPPPEVTTIRAIIVGEEGVGKTSLFFRIKDDVFYRDIPSHVRTIDSCSKMLDVDDRRIQFVVWDTAGVERYRTLTPNFYRGCEVALCVCSLVEPSSLRGLPKWIEDIQHYAPSSCLRVLVATKSDFPPKVTDEQLQDFADVYSCEGIYKVSVKSGAGIVEALKSVSRIALNQRSRASSFNTSGANVNLDKQSSFRKDGKCRC